MTLISLIPIIYNYVGGTALANTGDSLAVYAARLSIANNKGVAEASATADDVSNAMLGKLLNLIPALLNAVIFFIFYLYWDKRSIKATEEIKQEIKLPSYKTIEVSDHTDETTEKDIAEYMGRFGKVAEVAPVRNYEEAIALSREIYELSLKHKELRIENNSDTPTEKMLKIEKQIEELYKELAESEK